MNLVVQCLRGMLGKRGSRFDARWLLKYFPFLSYFFVKKKYLLVGASRCYGRVNGSVSESVSQ